MQQRYQSLDALRGFAILTMILSGSIAFGDVLPAWMYHAQVPPPLHKFNEAVVGITWVDLVFPFFLFSLGAAVPLALQKQVAKQSSFVEILGIASRRFILLAFFALFTQHMKAWVIEAEPTTNTYLLSIFAFVLLFFQFYENKNYSKIFFVVKLLSYAIAIALLYFLKFNNTIFSFYKSDIIIMVLANMAFFGTIIWWVTKNNVWARVGILPFVMAVFFAAKEVNGGWAKAFYNFSQIGMLKFDWLYKFYFLKYLFIVIPGTIAGDYLLKNKIEINQFAKTSNKNYSILLCFLAFSIVITNTIFLFTRQLHINLFITIFILFTIFFLLKKNMSSPIIVKKFFTAGAYLLLLGLFFEAFEGGIKKDHSTYSYYFVTSGLAFFMLLGFTVFTTFKFGSSINNFLSLNGRNPMLAYVLGSLLLLPLLHITGLINFYNSLNSSGLLGFFKGVLFTSIISICTIFCTKKSWFWKT
jgi:predicted acyltransferase